MNTQPRSRPSARAAERFLCRCRRIHSGDGARRRDARSGARRILGKGQDHGFSLVELLVAMVVTILVIGSVYGLLSGGQSAFRRQPELVERQQNIRVALDMVARDVTNAGAGLDAFAAAFTDGLNKAGDKAFKSVVYPNQKTDILEILANDTSCPSLSVCGNPGASVVINTNEPVPECFGLGTSGALVYVSGSAGPASSKSAIPGLLMAFEPGGKGPCGGHLNFPMGKAPAYNPGGGPGGICPSDQNCEYISKAEHIAYLIAPDSDGTPSLWRSPAGRFAADGTPVLPPSNPWQLLARGIEDLQVQYLTGANAALAGEPENWPDVPGDPGCATPTCTEADYNTIVRQVRITLSARTNVQNIEGMTTSEDAGTALRGRLTTIVAPRAAMVALSQPGPPPLPLWK